MRHRYLIIIIILLVFAAGPLVAAEGLFQMNSVFQRSTFPMFGSGGKDVIRYTGAGVGLKSTRGSGLQGVIDISILFPYSLEEKIYPLTIFSDRAITGYPVALDGLVGLGYLLEADPMSFFFSGGFHTGSLFEGGSTLVAFGLGVDAQAFIRMGEVLTAQAGGKFAVDFGGVQTFVSGSNQFAGFPISFAFYTGIGLKY